MSVLIMFHSLTYAQRGARVLERAGITAAVTKAPQSTTDRGCTYCIRIGEKALSAALTLLEKNQVRRGRILRMDPDDGYREVFL